MRAKLFCTLAVVLALVCPGLTAASFAQYDMSGRWVLWSPGPYGIGPWQLDVQQVSGQIYVTQWTALYSSSDGGQFDENTGEFHFYYGSGTCGTTTLIGHVAADSKTFSATLGVYGYVWVPGMEQHGGHFECGGPQNIPISGSRCGNEQIDAGEDCDDGNVTNGDCCTSSCALGADGAACSELHGCGTGTCSAGSCVLGSFAAGGTQCTVEGNLCIADACDGSGSCGGTTLAAAGTECEADTDHCTDDKCDASGNCVHPFNTAPCNDDGDPCTTDICDGAGNCTHPFNTAPCTSDGNSCTTDVCDGAGACTHVFNTSPCESDGSTCTTDVCNGAGICEHIPIAAGSYCDADSNPCSPDACNASGQCIAGDEIDCGPCGICDGSGCRARTFDCDESSYHASIVLGSDPDNDGTHAKLKISLRQLIDASALGDPTGATAYRICLNRLESGAMRTFAQMTLPAGAGWTATSRGFAWKDSTLAADGISAVRLDSAKGIKIAGKGANLPTAELDWSDLEYINAMLVAVDGATNPCWGVTLATDTATTTKLKGGY